MESATPHKNKPRWNLFQNSAWMIARAARFRPVVLWQIVLLALLAVASNLFGLYLPPVIVEKVSSAVPLPELFLAIGFFTGGLILTAALTRYLDNNTLFPRVDLRCTILMDIRDKNLATSYPNVTDKQFTALYNLFNDAICSNSGATEAIWRTLGELLKNLLGFALYLAVLSRIDPFLLLVSAVTAVLSYLASHIAVSWRERHREEEEAAHRGTYWAAQLPADRNYAKDLLIFGMRPFAENYFLKKMSGIAAFNLRAEKNTLFAAIVKLLLELLRNGIAYAYLIAMTVRGQLTVAEFLLYFAAVGGFTTWLVGILENFNTLHRQSIDISRIREYLTFPEVFKFDDGKPLSPDLKGDFEITLRHVSYRYPEASKDTIHDMNLVIHPGEKLAIVGLNGAGKTTLIKLICGLFDPTEGEVLLNGEDIRQYNRYDYYALISAVFQDVWAISLPLRQIVAQSSTDIDDVRVENALRMAGLWERAGQLPHGLDTVIGREVEEDGVELSGGELQRLLLARALYKNAPIVILDEPTAALDPIAENDIYQKYHTLTGGRTSVYISHRLASTRFCDRILYLEDGAILEEGTHDALMQKGGKYASLFAVQSQYYN